MSRPATIKDHRIIEATRKLVETPMLLLPSLSYFAMEIGVTPPALHHWLKGDCMIARKTIEQNLDRKDAIGEWARTVAAVYVEQEHDRIVLNKARSRAKTRQLTSLLNSSRGGRVSRISGK